MTIPSQLSAVQLVLPGTMVVLLGILLVVLTLGGFGQAAGTVRFVLAGTLLLYVGYGALMQITSLPLLPFEYTVHHWRSTVLRIITNPDNAMDSPSTGVGEGANR